MTIALWILGYIFCGWVTTVILQRIDSEAFFYKDSTGFSGQYTRTFASGIYGACVFFWPGFLLVACVKAISSHLVKATLAAAEFDVNRFATDMRERRLKSDLPIPHEPQRH